MHISKFFSIFARWTRAAKNGAQIYVVYMTEIHKGTVSDQASKRMLDAAGITYEKMSPIEITLKSSEWNIC